MKISELGNPFYTNIYFDYGCSRFLDSYRLLMASLDSVAKSLDSTDFIYTRKNHGDSEEKFNLIRKKGTYPYEWLDDIKKFNNTELPPKESFYSKLLDSHISVEDYTHAKTVWEKFNCKTFLDYHKIYLQTDVFLLTDCFEKF